MRKVAGEMDELARKIGTCGLPAVPAYLAAITLQNAAHYVIGHPPETIKAVNRSHRVALNEMLNGTGENSLNYLIAHTPKPVPQPNITDATENVSLPSDIKLPNDVFDVGKEYKLATLDTEFWIQYALFTYCRGKEYKDEVIYSYDGFKNTAPVLTQHFKRTAKVFFDKVHPDYCLTQKLEYATTEVSYTVLQS
jgi:hypothetical protein